MIVTLCEGCADGDTLAQTVTLIVHSLL